MAEKNNANCSICGKGYHKCLSCKDQINAAPWKVHTCSAEHYKVYQIIRGLSTGVYDKLEARSRFENVDLSDMNTFRDNIKKIVKDVMKQEVAQPVVEVAQQAEEQQVVEPQTDTSVVEQDFDSMPKIRRRKAFETNEAE